MFLVRDIMFYKPGQARPMVQKFLALDQLGETIKTLAFAISTRSKGKLARSGRDASCHRCSG
jgi:hypothetical protein